MARGINPRSTKVSPPMVKVLPELFGGGLGVDFVWLGWFMLVCVAVCLEGCVRLPIKFSHKNAIRTWSGRTRWCRCSCSAPSPVYVCVHILDSMINKHFTSPQYVTTDAYTYIHTYTCIYAPRRCAPRARTQRPGPPWARTPVCINCIVSCYSCCATAPLHPSHSLDCHN